MKVLLALCLVLFSIFCDAQHPARLHSNSIYLEVGKTGLLPGVYFDRLINKQHVGVRVGAGSNFGRYLTASFAGGGIYYLKGNYKTFLELGADVSYLNVEVVSDDQGIPLFYPRHPTKTLYTSVNVGLRSYGRNDLFRIGLAPGFTKAQFIPGAYISAGITF